MICVANSATMNFVTIVFLAVLCLQTQLQLSLSEPTGKKCSDSSNTCACKTDKGTIDLKPIISEPGASPPRFANLPDSGDFSYNYNPCVSYQGAPGGECTTGVYACQVPNADPTNGYAIAQADTEEMYIDDNGEAYLYYTGTDSRETRVDVQCDSKADPSELHVTTTGDSEVQLHYKFVMTGCQVCVGGCSGSVDPKTKQGVAVGIIGVVFLVTILAALLIYFIIGAVVMKVKYQATGNDIVPNKIFWIALPGLIKEGFVCTFGPPFRYIRFKIRGGQGYEVQKDSV